MNIKLWAVLAAVGGGGGGAVGLSIPLSIQLYALCCKRRRS